MKMLRIPHQNGRFSANCNGKQVCFRSILLNLRLTQALAGGVCSVDHRAALAKRTETSKGELSTN